MSSMAKKRSADCSNKANINKKIKRSNLKQEEEDDHHQDQKPAMAVDTPYTSHLPDLLVHQILLRLPAKHAIRASLLSKQWAQVWSCGVLVSDLEYVEDSNYHLQQPSSDNEHHRRAFFKFLRLCLKRHEKHKHEELEKFRLCMRYLGGSKMIDKWVSLAIERKVKVIDIVLKNRVKKCDSYKLPQNVLNSKYLISLSLDNVKIKGTICLDSCLPSLKTMSLKNLHFKDAGLFDFINSQCPSVESLSLTSCKFSVSIEVSASTLKSLEIIGWEYPPPKIMLTLLTMNLESFKFGRGRFPWPCFDFTSCRKSLRNFEFSSTFLPYAFTLFENLDLTFPNLENLVLHQCKHLSRDFSIVHKHLNRLVFYECKPSYEKSSCTINTPNLHSFVLTPSHVFYGFNGNDANVSLTAPNLSEATINFSFPLLTNLVQKFCCSRKIKLCLRDNDAQVLILLEELRKACSSPLPSVKQLKVAAINFTPVPRDVYALRDLLVWMSPSLKLLSLKHNSMEIVFQ